MLFFFKSYFNHLISICRRRNCGQFTNTTCVKKISPGSELKPHFVPQTGNISDPSQDRNRKQQPESNREITFSVQLALYISKKFCENRIVQCPHGIRCAIFTSNFQSKSAFQICVLMKSKIKIEIVLISHFLFTH